MTTVTTPRGSRSIAHAARTTGVAVVAALAGNLAVFALALLLGATFDVTRPDGVTFTVDAGSVLLMTALPLVIGGLALAVAGRWGRRGRNALAWTGLGIGLVTVVMPLSTEADAGTKLALASMHVITGLAWFLLLRRHR